LTVKGLDRVVHNLRNWNSRMKAATFALAQNWAGKLEREMKEKAPWTDRTGNARAGLYGTTEWDGNDVVIRIGHTVVYGVYLELAHDGRYAIVKPTQEANKADLLRDFRELWGQ